MCGVQFGGLGCSEDISALSSTISANFTRIRASLYYFYKLDEICFLYWMWLMKNISSIFLIFLIWRSLSLSPCLRVFPCRLSTSFFSLKIVLYSSSLSLSSAKWTFAFKESFTMFSRLFLVKASLGEHWADWSQRWPSTSLALAISRLFGLGLGLPPSPQVVDTVSMFGHSCSSLILNPKSKTETTLSAHILACFPARNWCLNSWKIEILRARVVHNSFLSASRDGRNRDGYRSQGCRVV